MSITEFLMARYDERESAARAAMDADPAYAHYGDTAAEAFLALAVSEGETEEAAAHFERWRPEHVLADIAAKRAIVKFADVVDGMAETIYQEFSSYPDEEGADLLKILVQPYADHPDFDPAWKVA
jgi:hypothetical protein